MALSRPYPIDKAWPNAIDLRRQLSGVLPREGVFPDPVTVDQGVAYAGSGWAVGARPFVAAFKRGGAPHSQAYGTGLGTNDAAVAAAWTVGGAPGSGSRIDRLWVRWVDPTQGESLTTPGGETVARAVPVFGVTAGTPGLAALPAGVQEIAQVSVPAGAGSIAGATITQVHPFAHVVGGTIVVRTKAERDALATADLVEGRDVCYVIGTDQGFVWLGSTIGWVHLFGKPDTAAVTYAGIYSAGPTAPLQVYMHGGRVFAEGIVTSSSATFVAATQYTLGSIPASAAPKNGLSFAAVSNVTALAEITVSSGGSITLKLSPGFTGALSLWINASWALKSLI